jgi:hypothetical protein
LLCCENQRLATEISIRGLLKELLQGVLEVGDTNREDYLLALVPALRSAPLVKVLQKGRALPLGAIAIFGTRALISFGAQLSALEVLTDLLDVLDLFLPDSCNECINKNLWQQKNRQIKLTLPSRRRVPL